jgi:hypothetical protein
MPAKNLEEEDPIYYPEISLKRKKHTPGPYSSFNIRNRKPEKDIILNIADIAGSEGDRVLYDNNGLKVKWVCDNVSGSHNDAGTIKFIYGNPSKLIARMPVRRKYIAYRLEIYDLGFASILDENKKMKKLYGPLKKLFIKK